MLKTYFKGPYRKPYTPPPWSNISKNHFWLYLKKNIAPMNYYLTAVQWKKSINPIYCYSNEHWLPGNMMRDHDAAAEATISCG